MIDQAAEVNSDTDHKIINFFEKYTAFSVPARTTVIQSDEHADWIYYLASGTVKQTVTTQKGQELSVNIFKPGSFFPLIEGIANIPNVYAFTTLTECTGWKAPVSDVKKLLQENADISYSLLTRLLKGLHGLLIKSEKLMQGDARSLVAQTLLVLDQRFPGSDALTIDLSLTHQQLADSTGLSRETVSRELSALRALNMIAIEHHKITLLDIVGLKRLGQTVNEITVL